MDKPDSLRFEFKMRFWPIYYRTGTAKLKSHALQAGIFCNIKFQKRNSCSFIQENALKNVVFEMSAIMSRSQCVNWVKFIPNRCHEQAVMKLWRVTNIIGMPIHKELLIVICAMQYIAISITVYEISLWRHFCGSESCRSGGYMIDSPECPSVDGAVTG